MLLREVVESNIPGGVQETTGHGTQCHGALHKMVFRHGLDLILKVFSKNESIILQTSVFT